MRYIHLLVLQVISLVGYSQYQYMFLSQKNISFDSITIQVLNFDSIYEGREVLILETSVELDTQDPKYNFFYKSNCPLNFGIKKKGLESWSGNEIGLRDSINSIFWSGKWYLIKVSKNGLDTLGKFINLTSSKSLLSKNSKEFGKSDFLYISKKLFSSIYYYKNGRIEGYTHYSKLGKITDELLFYRNGKVEALLDFNSQLYYAYNRRGKKIIREYVVLGNITNTSKVRTRVQ